jgi:Tfp pilus tip-associated adhesin PilY1
MDLTGRGEQTVTSPLIFGGLVYFSTNRATPQTPGMCTANLGEARGYAVNLLNASGGVGTQQICGGARSNIFTGGGLPPTPVTAMLPINGKPTSVLFGGVQRSGGASSAIGAQQIKPAMTGKRTRMYWYTHGNK